MLMMMTCRRGHLEDPCMRIAVHLHIHTHMHNTLAYTYMQYIHVNIHAYTYVYIHADDCVQLLLEAGADFEAQTETGERPLHLAILRCASFMSMYACMHVRTCICITS